ncbi:MULTISPECIES: MmpS family transport accessory protein [unclassified Mycobacterium]|uniref:MmpS family transport accessory protein n=1 Tax=unclassified Mycobacterium TaxID=2642494 RepID=UPI0018D44B71|nr:MULTISPECIES: MmpS family transport accessory protein [unclassified Mycobacterium]
MTKHRRGLRILFAVGVGWVATVPGVAQAIPQMPQARYEVTGGPVAQYISYQTDAGQLHQVNVPLPWSTEFTSFGGQVFVISAQGAGPLRCRILLDGNVVADAQSAGGRTVCAH